MALNTPHETVWEAASLLHCCFPSKHSFNQSTKCIFREMWKNAWFNKKTAKVSQMTARSTRQPTLQNREIMKTSQDASSYFYTSKCNHGCALPRRSTLEIIRHRKFQHHEKHASVISVINTLELQPSHFKFGFQSLGFDMLSHWQWNLAL